MVSFHVYQYDTSIHSFVFDLKEAKLNKRRELIKNKQQTNIMAYYCGPTQLCRPWGHNIFMAALRRHNVL